MTQPEDVLKLPVSDSDLRALAAGDAMFRPHVVVHLLDRLESAERVIAAAEACVNAFFSHAVSDRTAEQRAKELDQAVTAYRLSQPHSAEGGPNE